FISWPSGGPALATPLLERARELAVDGSPRLRVRTDTAWAFSTFLSGDPTGIAVIEAAVPDALANPEADTTDFAWSWGTLGTYGNMAKWTERFTEAARAYEIGMQAADRLRALATRLQILEPCVVPWAGDAITAYLYGGRIDDARAIVTSLESMGERLPCRFPRIVALGSRAALKQIDGDLEAVHGLLGEAIALATASGMPVLEARLRH